MEDQDYITISDEMTPIRGGVFRLNPGLGVTFTDKGGDIIVEAPELIAALETIAKRPHADTCSFAFVSGSECDCHVSIARKALKETVPNENHA